MTKANGNYQSFSVVDGGHMSPLSEMPGVMPTANSDIASSQIVEVDGVVLADGRILDLVRSQSPDGLAFLVWNDGEFTVENRVTDQDRVYAPPKLPRGLAAAVRLPSGLGPYLPARQLMAEIAAHAQVYLGLPEDEGFLIAAFALSTFFPDVLPLAVYLIICGPPGGKKTTLLRFLHCVTRRALHAGEATRASLYKVSDQIAPTWLLDEADEDRTKTSRELMRVLRNGNRPGADTLVNGQLYRTYGPKVICGRRGPEDTALTSRAIRITVTPGSEALPLLDLDAERRIAEDMQPKLERFRLERYRDVRMPELPGASSFTPRMREIARVLAAPFLGDANLTDRLLRCLKPQDEAARIDRYGEPEWVVAAALFRVSHESGNRMFIGNLGLNVNCMLRETGETYHLSDKAVGKIARESLGVTTKRIGLGYYLELTLFVRRQIHQLARNMGLTKADILNSHAAGAGYGGHPCALCTEFGLNTLPDGRQLRYVEAPRPVRRREPLFGPEEKRL